MKINNGFEYVTLLIFFLLLRLLSDILPILLIQSSNFFLSHYYCYLIFSSALGCFGLVIMIISQLPLMALKQNTVLPYSNQRCHLRTANAIRYHQGVRRDSKIPGSCPEQLKQLLDIFLWLGLGTSVFSPVLPWQCSYPKLLQHYYDQDPLMADLMHKCDIRTISL